MDAAVRDQSTTARSKLLITDLPSCLATVHTARTAAGDGDWQQWLDELGPACCGDGGDPGTPQSPYCKGQPDQNGIIIPTIDGNPGSATVCSPECADLFEDMYAECHPRFEELGIGEQMKGVLGTCQGTPYTPGTGGGHRRQLAGGEEEVVVSGFA